MLAIQDLDRPVSLLQHFNRPARDRVEMPGWRDLEHEALERNGVVLGHHPLLSDAEYLLKFSEAWRSAKYRFSLACSDTEASVVLAQDFLQDGVCLLACAGVSEPELDHQAVLQEAPLPFDTALGLGRVGRDDPDPELGHGTTELGERLLAA